MNTIYFVTVLLPIAFSLASCATLFATTAHLRSYDLFGFKTIFEFGVKMILTEKLRFPKPILFRRINR